MYDGQPVVDIDDPSSWPARFAERVHELAHDHRCSTEEIGDLQVDQHEEELGELEGCLLRVYHCTRLLDHEEQTVREQGLRLDGDQLVRDRLGAALIHGHLTQDEHAQLLGSATFGQYRIVALGMIIGKAAFENHAHQLHRLLATWGGEGVYIGHERGQGTLYNRLRKLGRPTIVTARMDLAAAGAGRRPRVWPGIAKVFVGAALGLPDPSAQVTCSTAIPPRSIERLVHPGDPTTTGIRSCRTNRRIRESIIRDSARCLARLLAPSACRDLARHTTTADRGSRTGLVGAST